MGTTSIPLQIVITPELYDSHQAAWEELAAQGHTLKVMIIDADVIFSPRAWRLLPEHMEYLPLALKEVRAATKATQSKGKQKAPK